MDYERDIKATMLTYSFMEAIYVLGLCSRTSSYFAFDIVRTRQKHARYMRDLQVMRDIATT